MLFSKIKSEDSKFLLKFEDFLLFTKLPFARRVSTLAITFYL